MGVPSYTVLFDRIGKAVKTANDLLALQAIWNSKGAEADALFDQFEDARYLVNGVLSSFDSFAGAAASLVGVQKTVVDSTLLDLANDLNVLTGNVSDMLPALYEDMVTNSQTVKANTVGSPTVTAGGSNVGTGSLVVTKKDAYGRDAETIIAESVLVQCTESQYSGGTAGGESFSIDGYGVIDATTYGTRGNGSSAISVLDSSNLLSNGTFDTFDTNAPSDWTIDLPASAGPGTVIFEEDTTVHVAGGSSLKLQGNGSTATVTLHQDVSGFYSARKMLVAGVWLRKGGGTFASGSTLTIRLTGTGFTPVNIYSADPSTLTTAFALKSAFLPVGDSFPADLKLEITWTTAGGVANTGQIFIDDFVLAEPLRFGDVYYGLFRGNVNFVVGDNFTVATTNNYGGVLQTFFGRFYGVQLPSATGGAETISDTVAT